VLSTTVSSALKKSSELWSINHKVVFAYSDSPNIDSARVSEQFWTLTAIISRMKKISTSGKRCFQLLSIPRQMQKNGGLGFTKHKVVFAHFDLPNIDSLRVFSQLLH